MPAYYKGRKAEVGTLNGAPVLLIDGKPRTYTHYKITERVNTPFYMETVQEEVPPLINGGIRLCWIPVFVYSKGPGQYDFADMDARINAFVDAVESTGKAEDFAFVIRIQAASFSPAWYVEKSKKDGKYTNMLEFRSLNGGAEKPDFNPETERFGTARAGFRSTYAISLGDEFWDTVALDMLRAIVDHARQQPYYKYVFGWLPTAMNTNEWFIHSHLQMTCCDHSEPTQRAFAQWLRARGIEAGDHPVPTPQECYAGALPVILCNVGTIKVDYEQPVIDPSVESERRVELFSRYLNERVAGIIENFAHVLREMTADDPKLIGTFYGYTIEGSFMTNLAQFGHLCIRKLLECKDIDFFCSPCLYSARSELAPLSLTTVLGAYCDSAKLYNKLVFAEDDHSAVSCFTYANCRDSWHDRQAFYRNFAMVTAHGQYEWFYSISGKWLVPKDRAEATSILNEKAIELLKTDRSPVAEVAILMDEASVSAMKLDAPLVGNLLRGTVGELAACGVPYDIYETHSFLEKADHKPYKFILFANQVVADAETLEQINKLKAEGRTLYFQYDAGYRTADALSLDNASALTGIKLESSETQPLSLWCDPDRNNWNGDEDIRYGMWDCNLTPLKSVDPDAEVLGWLFLGDAGLVRKKYADWTAVWSAVPALPAAALRRLIAAAGVKMYAPLQTAVFANASFFSVSAGKRGNVKLSVPDCRVLKDLMTGEEIPPDAELYMKRHETRMFLRVK